MKKTYIAPEVLTLDLFEESAVMLTGSVKVDGGQETEVILSNKKDFGPKSIWGEE